MNAPRDPDRLIHAFLQEGRIELTDQVYDAVRADIEHRRQRAVFGPWRMPDMNKFIAIGLGVAAVVVVVFAGAQLLGPPSPSGVGAGSSVQPSAAPSPTPRPSPSASPATSPPPLTRTLTSRVNGISLSYPEGWSARPAGEPWTEGPEGVLAEADRDVMYDPVQNEGLFLFVVSQPIGDSTPEDWVAARMAEPVPEQGCATPEPITVDGATGLIGAGDCDLAVVTTAGRGYEIFFYNDHAFDALYDRAWFEEVLATIQLQPEDAVDVAPPPPLNQAFTSQVHGITLSYPEGWIARGATEPWRDRPGVPQFTDPGYDVLRDPVLDDRVFLDITSQPIGDATPADWLAAIPAGSGCTTTEPITVDGATGVIGANDCNVVWVTTAGRGYTIELFRSNDDPAAVAPYDRAWFEEVLATIQLQPGDAVDAAPSATP